METIQELLALAFSFFPPICWEWINQVIILQVTVTIIKEENIKEVLSPRVGLSCMPDYYFLAINQKQNFWPNGHVKFAY